MQKENQKKLHWSAIVYLSSCLAGLLSFAFVSFASATTVDYSQNFDSYASGATSVSGLTLNSWVVTSSHYNSSGRGFTLSQSSSSNYFTYAWDSSLHPTMISASSYVLFTASNSFVIQLYTDSSSSSAIYGRFSVYTSGNGQFHLGGSGVSSEITVSDQNYLNSWHYVTFIYDIVSNTQRMYIDGILHSTSNPPGVLGSYLTSVKFSSNSSGYNTFYVDDIVINQGAVNGSCGSANGVPTITEPTEGFCNSGTLVTPSLVYGNFQWTWTCAGSNGGGSASCYAPLDTTTPFTGVCGSDNGQTLSTPPTNFCSVGTVLYPTVMPTTTGYSWTCSGVNGGESVNCSSILSTITSYPAIVFSPTDCSGLGVVDTITCNIGNFMGGIFAPSQEKWTELENTKNQIGNLFPFNYISTAVTAIKSINIGNNSTLTIAGSSFDLSTLQNIELFADIKKLITIIVILLFVGWAISYIKHFFK